MLVHVGISGLCALQMLLELKIRKMAAVWNVEQALVLLVMACILFGIWTLQSQDLVDATRSVFGDVAILVPLVGLECLSWQPNKLVIHSLLFKLHRLLFYLLLYGIQPLLHLKLPLLLHVLETDLTL